MNKSTKYYFNIILYTLPLFAWADQYPINKNIDIKHYSFQLRLTDSNDEIIGTTQVTVNFKQAGMQNFRLDLINKSSEKKEKGMVVEGVSISNATVKYTHENSKGLLHYVIFESDVVVLSEVDTKKVAYIDKNGTLDVSFDIESEGYDLIDVTVIRDEDYVQRVYDYMIETNNAYFFNGIEGLIGFYKYYAEMAK